MRINASINIKSMSIKILTWYVLTASLYVSIFNSLIIQIVILGFILGILVINELTKRGTIYFLKTDIFFFLAIITVLGSLRGSTFTTSEIADPIVISLAILISFFIRGNINNFDKFFSLVKWGGIFFALSVFFAFFSPTLYNKTFLKLLRPQAVETIMSSTEKGMYTGFTGQVAYTAGYLVGAIGIILCSWIVSKGDISKKGLLLFLILLFGLLLTQKRAHLLFMIFSLLLVYIQYTRNLLGKILKLFKSIFGMFLGSILIIIFVKLTGLGNTLFLRIQETVKSITYGDDITSNRIPLWEHAWDIFLENPIIGIGWGNFRKTVIGNVTVHTEMETHNIYLQLLSETGIIGTVFILTPFLITYFYTIKITRLVSLNKDKYSYKWSFAILFSLYTQTFFLLYGLTGNPLYDYSFLIMYISSFALMYSFWQNHIISLKSKNITKQGIEIPMNR